jgi:hypothetical protein
VPSRAFSFQVSADAVAAGGLERSHSPPHFDTGLVLGSWPPRCCQRWPQRVRPA